MSAQSGSTVFSFGRFRLFRSKRLLTADGARLELGARTLDLLIALVSRPNEVLSKRDLLASIWADATVDEGSLRFQIAALRGALGDGMGGARYIETIAGRGYCFVAPVLRSDEETAVPSTEMNEANVAFLPARLARMVGRSKDIDAIATELTKSRFVTIVGSGGVGKTTTAVAVAHQLLQDFSGAVAFVDLGTQSDPALVAPFLASVLGLSVQTDDATPILTSYLTDRRLLLVLDSCEHVIEAAARLAAGLFAAAPQVHILATSREALLVDNERVHTLAPLAFPSNITELTAAIAIAFPAIQLFVDRAMANGALTEMSDSDAPIVAGICRKLDGVPLAIELAAGRVAAFGLEQTKAFLDKRLALQWPGMRTAPPRQKSLTATLDWSYSLLSEEERAVLCRLAVFIGPFPLDAAQAVAAGSDIDRIAVIGLIESLVGKSMVATHSVGPQMRYRLLDTTRAYVLGFKIDHAERVRSAARHANHYQNWLEQTATAWRTLANATQRASDLADLSNVRAALDWSFGDDGDTEIGISLAVAAAPVFFAMSLLTDCQRWSQRAILELSGAALGGHAEMRLQAALGLSLMWTRGNSHATYAALSRSIAIAEVLGDTRNQIRLLAPRHVSSMITGEFAISLELANKVLSLAQTVDDSSAHALSRILRGYSLHFNGDQIGARRDLEWALYGETYAKKTSGSATDAISDDAMSAPILALATAAAPSALARALWLQGEAPKALQLVQETVRDAANADHPVRLLVALIYAISVMLWNGDLDEADNQIGLFISNATQYSLGTHVVLGHCFRGRLLISRGQAKAGLDILQAALAELRALRYELLTPEFNISLAEALAALGNVGEGIELIDETIRVVERGGAHCYSSELLRVKAGLQLLLPRPEIERAETCLVKSLAVSRQQGALAWELRTAIDMAKLSASRGGTNQARALVQSVCSQFAEGSETADLKVARSLTAA